MIFLAGMLCGAVVALGAWLFITGVDTTTDEKTETSSDSERLNAEKKEHERFMKEQQRQFDMLMKYTGEKQKG